MKTITKIILAIATALLIASLICFDRPTGFIAAGLYVFCFVMSRDFREVF